MKKVRMGAVLLAAVLAVGLLPASAGAAEPDGGRCVPVISPRYAELGHYAEGRVAARQGDLWGYLDTEGEIRVGFRYDLAFPYSEGCAVVAEEKTLVREVTDPDSGQVRREGTAVYAFGRVDRAGDYVPLTGADGEAVSIPVELWESRYAQSAPQYCGGFCLLMGSLYDRAGQLLVPERQGLTVKYAMTEGLAAATDAGGYGTVYLDESGKAALELAAEYDGGGIRYVEARPFHGGLAPAAQCRGSWSPDAGYTVQYAWGFLDRQGNWAIQPRFEAFFVREAEGRYQVFSEGLASVRQNGLYGAIDRQGNTVIPFEYEELRSFFEGLAVFRRDGKYGFVDRQGREVIPARYESAAGFSGGCALVCENGRVFCIDRQGEKIPGTEDLDPRLYFREEGAAVSPGEYAVTRVNGRCGLSRIQCGPALPAQGEASVWALPELTAALEAGLVPAGLQNQYREDISRREFAGLVMRLLEQAKGEDMAQLVWEHTGRGLYELIGELPFRDSTEEAVVAANALGIINGRGERVFDPEAPIRREEAAALLSRAAAFLGEDIAAVPAAGFLDGEQVASWFREAVDYVSAAGIMGGAGDGTFAPGAPYTREQSVLTMWRLYQQVIQ